MKQKGFTLIELMVVLVIIMVIGTMVMNAMGVMNGNSNISYGINGVTESRCIEGYKFVISQDSTRQILDEFGKGVRCESQLNLGK